MTTTNNSPSRPAIKKGGRTGKCIATRKPARQSAKPKPASRTVVAEDAIVNTVHDDDEKISSGVTHGSHLRDKFFLVPHGEVTSERIMDWAQKGTIAFLLTAVLYSII